MFLNIAYHHDRAITTICGAPEGVGSALSHGYLMQNAPHILIVDDDLEIRKLLGRYLTGQEFRVTLASDRRSLKEALASNEISLIVLHVLRSFCSPHSRRRSSASSALKLVPTTTSGSHSIHAN